MARRFCIWANTHREKASSLKIRRVETFFRLHMSFSAKRGPIQRYPLCAAMALTFACGQPPPQSPADVEPEVTQAETPAPVLLEEPMPDTVVYAKFQANTQAIRPGGTFLLAVHFDIVGDYRISWTNPGDVGRGTVVEFSAPPEFRVSPVRFPVPQRFTHPDNLVSYGYEDETAVFAEVTAPANLSETKAYRFDVTAHWLACKKECATEELNAWFELVASPNASAPQLSQELRRHYQALPQAFSELEAGQHDWSDRHSRPALTLHADQVKWLDFFPGALEQPKVMSIQPRNDTLEVQFERRDDKPLRGLAVAEIEGQRAFFDVNVPWPER